MKLRFPYFYQIMSGFLVVIMTLIIVTSTSYYYFGRNQLLNNLEDTFFQYAEMIEDAGRNPEQLEVITKFYEISKLNTVFSMQMDNSFILEVKKMFESVSAKKS